MVSPFWFELMWLEILGFKDKVRCWWESFVSQELRVLFSGRSSKPLKEVIKWWNKECGRVEIQKSKLPIIMPRQTISIVYLQMETGRGQEQNSSCH